MDILCWESATCPANSLVPPSPANLWLGTPRVHGNGRISHFCAPQALPRATSHTTICAFHIKLHPPGFNLELWGPIWDSGKCENCLWRVRSGVFERRTLCANRSARKKEKKAVCKLTIPCAYTKSAVCRALTSRVSKKAVRTLCAYPLLTHIIKKSVDFCWREFWPG